jgi:hypothetical protein
MFERTRPIWLVAAMASLLLACSPTDHRKEVSESQAIAISRRAALSAGYDLRRYELDAFGDRTGGGNKQWLIVYLCSPGPPPPGCSFMVVVDRKSGAATVHRGE